MYDVRNHIGLAAGVGLIAAAILSPRAAEGRVWTVHADSTGDAPTIAAALDSAAAGDTVLVGGGVYTHIVADGAAANSVAPMKSGVTLLGEAGAAATIMDVSNPAASRGITCINCDGSTVIEGFTITGGDAFTGAGVYISGGAPVFRNNIFLDAYGGTGGGMLITGASQALIESNRFDLNVACCGIGCAMVVDQGSTPEIIDNIFFGNSGFGGGAVAFSQSGGVVRGNQFLSNTGTDGGALALQFGSDPLVEDNYFSDNESSNQGGAVQIWLCDNPIFRNNTVVGNRADGSGGGVSISSSSPEFSGNTIAGNNATSGGGVFITGSSVLELDHNIIAFNTGPGGIECDDPAASVSFACNDVFENAGNQYSIFCSDQTGTAGNISEDPRFCTDSYALESCSPALGGLGCGRMGAHGSECECTVTSTETASWGSVKGLFR